MCVFQGEECDRYRCWSWSLHPHQTGCKYCLARTHACTNARTHAQPQFSQLVCLSVMQLNEPSLVEGLVLINIDPCAKGWMEWAAWKVSTGHTRIATHTQVHRLDEHVRLCH